MHHGGNRGKPENAKLNKKSKLNENRRGKIVYCLEIGGIYKLCGNRGGICNTHY